MSLDVAIVSNLQKSKWLPRLERVFILIEGELRSLGKPMYGPNVQRNCFILNVYFVMRSTRRRSLRVEDQTTSVVALYLGILSTFEIEYR